MPQTLLALVSLMVAMQLSLLQQRSVLNARLDMVDSEYETIATGAGLDILDYVGSKPFDEAVITQTVTDPSDFTPLPFSTGGQYEDAVDIDDFNQIAPYVYNTDFPNVPFNIMMEVRYVEEDDFTQVATEQTFAKEVIVTLTNEHLEMPVTLSRVFTYP